MNRAFETRCPHCSLPMSRWTNPQDSTWTGAFQYVCFNDDCPYYIRGWEWMRSHFNVAGTYRHRLDPETGQSGPLPVWSADDFRAGIIPEEGWSHAV